MKLYKGYILASEFCKRAKITRPSINAMKNVEIEKMGSVVIFKKDQLNKKYLDSANKCLDLETYYTFSNFAETLGENNEYLYGLQAYRNKKLESIKVEGFRLLRLSKDFLEFVKEGYTPFFIKKDTIQYADKQVEMYGMKIGFYK